MSITYKPRIAIIGAGAIGNYLGANLAHAGYDVHFLLRRDYDSICAQGITVYRRHAPDFTVHPVQAYRSTEDIGPCDLVLIALKATHNENLARLLPPLVNEKTVIATLQNGLGSIAFLQQTYPTEQIIGGLCFMGINRDDMGSIHSFSSRPGALTIGEAEGPVTERLEDIADLFVTSGVPCRVSDNLYLEQWRKLVWNIPFNGLAIAAGGITVDRILAQPALREAARQLMLEVQAGARAQGLEIDDEHLQRQFASAENLGAYRPSSLIDYLEGRAVEVEAIFGEALRQGQKHGVEMPYLQLLYGIITSQVAHRASEKAPATS